MSIPRKRRHLVLSIFIVLYLVPGIFARQFDKIFNPYLRKVQTVPTTRSSASYSPTSEPSPSASTTRGTLTPASSTPLATTKPGLPTLVCPPECSCRFDVSGDNSANCTGQGPFASLITKLPQTLIMLKIGDFNQTALVVNMFRRFSLLRRLGLRNNNIDYIPTNSFLGLGLLDELDLGDNALTDTKDGSMFEGLRNIASMNLECNDFRSIPKTQLMTLRHLERLNLHGNLIDDVTRPPGMDDLELESLVHLNLSSNYIRTMYQLPFGLMGQLLTLDLSFNYISNIWPNSFDNTPNLGALLLGGNQLDSVDSRVFYRLRNLRILDLKGNQFSYVTDTMFSPLWKLQYVGLDRNPLTCDCRLDWMRAVLQSPRLDNFRWAKKWLRNEKDDEGNSISGTPTCLLPLSMAGMPLENFTIGDFTCSKPHLQTTNATNVFIAENEITKLEVIMWGGLPTAYWLFANRLHLEKGKTHNFTECNGSISVVEERLSPSTLIRTTAYLVHLPPTISGVVVVVAKNGNATELLQFNLTIGDRHSTTTVENSMDIVPPLSYSEQLGLGLGVTAALICIVAVVVVLMRKWRPYSRVPHESIELTPRPPSSATMNQRNDGDGDADSDRDLLITGEKRAKETQREEEEERAVGQTLQGQTTSLDDDGRSQLQTTEATGEGQSYETKEDTMAATTRDDTVA